MGYNNTELVGTSRGMSWVRSQLRQLAQVPWPVRIEGETGTGKGLAAHLLHQWSPRAAGPFVKCDINVLDDGLASAELMGHKRGAFTGAVQDRIGVFEAAHGGTLFLDELAAATSRVQLALLQLIEEHRVRRVGETRSREVSVRLIFATNSDLDAAIANGSFRRDLFYRLGSLVIRMPRLAEHAGDIIDLVAHFLSMKTQEIDRNVRRLTPVEMDALVKYEWPGNVRELERGIEHFVTFQELPESVVAGAREADRNWRDHIEEALEESDGVKTRAAKRLGVSRKTLYEELRRRNLRSHVERMPIV